MSKSKKCNYDGSSLNFDFSNIIKQGFQLTQCFLCIKTFENSFIKPHQLKQLLPSQPQGYAKIERAFFEPKEKTT